MTESPIEKRIDKSVTANTALSTMGNVVFGDMNQLMEFAKTMAIASIAIPKHLRDNPGACLAVAIQASEWQMSPFAVANKSYSVNDRLAYEAQLINAVILRRAPIVGRMKMEYSGEGEKRRCKVSVKCTDGEIVEYESPEIGKITVKNSPLWKGDPDQQLFYYSSRAMCRRHFPDVILGICTADEMEEMEQAAPRNVTPRTVENPFREPAPEPPFADLPSAKPVVEVPPPSTDSVEAWLARIEETGLERDPQITLSQFEAACRTSGDIGPKADIRNQSARRLETLFTTYDAILEKANAGGAE